MFCPLPGRIQSTLSAGADAFSLPEPPGWVVQEYRGLLILDCAVICKKNSSEHLGRSGTAEPVPRLNLDSDIEIRVRRWVPHSAMEMGFRGQTRRAVVLWRGGVCGWSFQGGLDGRSG